MRQREIAEKILKDRELLAKAQGKDKEAEQPQNKINQVRVSRSRGLAQSNFFAYSTASVEKGKKAFQDKWGQRALQDNWRRREALSVAYRVEEPEIASEEEEKPIDDEALQAILNEFPTSESDVARAEGRIEMALFEQQPIHGDGPHHALATPPPRTLRCQDLVCQARSRCRR